jgi:hypothetical protein
MRYANVPPRQLEGNWMAPAKQEIWAAVGRLTMAWNFLELSLDQSIFVLHRVCTPAAESGRLPVSLKRKVKYFRQTMDAHPLLAQFRADGLALVQRVQEFADDRHSIVHGAALGFTKDGRVRFVRATSTADQWSLDEWRLTVEEVHVLGTLMERLAQDHANFSHSLVSHFQAERKRAAVAPLTQSD